MLLKEIIVANGLNEDSIKLFYKANRSEDWTEYPHYTLDEIGNNTNGYSAIEIDSLLYGEYALGVYNYSVSVDENKSNHATITVRPNPSKGEITIEDFDLQKNSSADINVFDEAGKLILCKPATGNKLVIDTTHWARGIYFIGLNNSSEKIKFVKE